MSLLKLRKNEKVVNIVLKFVLVSKMSDFDMVNIALFFHTIRLMSNHNQYFTFFVLSKNYNLRTNFCVVLCFRVSKQFRFFNFIFWKLSFLKNSNLRIYYLDNFISLSKPLIRNLRTYVWRKCIKKMRTMPTNQTKFTFYRIHHGFRNNLRKRSQRVIFDHF